MHSVRVNRELFVISSEPNVLDSVRKIVEPFHFIALVDPRQLGKPRTDMHFVVGAVDFSSKDSVYHVTEQFRKINYPEAYKIMFVIRPGEPTREQLFFCTEIGSRYNAYGVDRDRDLRNYLKTIALQAEQIGSVTHYENEIARLIRRNDRPGLGQLDERLSEMDRDLQEILRLRALINVKLNRPVKLEACLKQILAKSPENIWAAYQLGGLYLRMGKPAEGIRILEKLSRFNDLNVDRLVELGEAYLNAGDSVRAEGALQKGQVIAMGHDQRLNENLAKAKLLTGDIEGALASSRLTHFSESVVSFLNMRAILAIKTGQFAQGLKLYKAAISKCVEDNLILAKLHYNMGLGCIRAGIIDEASNYFARSVQFGGEAFDRAAGPLEVTRKILARGASAAKAADFSQDDENFEFEDMGLPQPAFVKKAS